jgi:putative PIN family toxin of toxin-antitoxin system
MDVVIDTNVVVSGLLFKGVPDRIVSLWQQSVITPYVTQDIIDEYIRVLAYPKFQLSRLEIEYLIYREILAYFETVTPSTACQIVPDDPADDMVIHCAMAGSIETIISGDSHLLDLGTYGSICILHPADFLQRFQL